MATLAVGERPLLLVELPEPLLDNAAAPLDDADAAAEVAALFAGTVETGAVENRVTTTGVVLAVFVAGAVVMTDVTAMTDVAACAVPVTTSVETCWLAA